MGHNHPPNRIYPSVLSEINQRDWWADRFNTAHSLTTNPRKVAATDDLRHAQLKSGPWATTTILPPQTPHVAFNEVDPSEPPPVLRLLLRR